MTTDGAPLDLLVVADSREGGLGASATAHARWFARRGWSVALAAPGPGPEPIDGVDVVALPDLHGAFELPAVLRAGRVLRAHLIDRRPRVVHAHGTRSQLLALVAGRRPYVTMHGAGGRLPGQGLAGHAVRTVGKVVAARLAAGAFSAAPAAGRWTTTVHASPALSRLPLLDLADTGTPTFLWVGRLDRPKRPELFVRACALAAAKEPVRGLVVGDGPLAEPLRALVGRLAAPVTMAGSVDDVAPYLEQARAICLFSDFEGVPFSVQEAMWVGRPVVVSPLSGMRWFCGTAARYAATAEEVAAELVGLCDYATARTLGAAAADRVRQMVSPDSPFPMLQGAYASAAPDVNDR